MTKSTITRERLEQLANFKGAPVTRQEEQELARMALAAMDSEPVAYMHDGEDGTEYNGHDEFSGGGKGIPLYRHAQPAPVVPTLYSEEVNEAAWVLNDMLTKYGPLNGEQFNNLKGCFYAALKVAMLSSSKQPAPVVPKSISVRQAISALESADAVTTIGQAYKMGWNACRAAMLNQAQEPATYNTAPQPAVVSDEMIDTFEAEFRRAFKVSPEVKQMLEIGYHGEKFSFSIRDAATWWKLGRAAMLAAAPQSPGSEPATVPGKWIPVSERMPEDRTQVILWDAEIGEVTSGHYSHKTHTFYHCGDAIENEITHWMAPPAAPQEVKSES